MFLDFLNLLFPLSASIGLYSYNPLWHLFSSHFSPAHLFCQRLKYLNASLCEVWGGPE